ncbi:cytochrome P450 4C1-like [Armigeres subalbatus]|uniref:cytochrome P450 4C1-like n=1 Tax=Armigeres subalbatus TaxID=124917 RepID=UPI002ED554EB
MQAEKSRSIKMWYAILVIGAVLSIAIIWSIVQKNSFSKNIDVLQPWYPIVGNMFMLIGKDDLQKFEIIYRECSRADKLFRFYMGPKPMICTGHPDMAKQILTDANCFDKPYLYDFLMLKNGVFASKTHIWKGQRRALLPAFNTRILASFLSIFINRSKNMISKLESVAVTGETFNILDHATSCTLRIVCETTMGFDSSAFNSTDEFAASIERALFIAARRMVKYHYHLNFIYRWSKDYREEQSVREYLADQVMQVYNNSHDRYSKGLMNNTADVDENQCFRKPQIFINELFTSTIRKFEREEIIDNILSMMIAGTDTSANAIAFTLLQLAMDSHYQQKVYEEIMQVFPGEEPNISMEGLRQLQLTEMVLNETLRLYPVAPIVLRENTAKITLCDQLLPKGSMLAINIFTIHRRKDQWGPDADCFNPERFSPEKSAGRHPFAFLAFSGGSRNCLGIRYAMISMKIMLIYLMKSFRFKTNIRQEDIRFRFDAVLRIEGGHMIQIEKR